MLPFVGPSYTLPNAQAAAQRTVNMYLQRVETPEKGQFILVAMPGFEQFSSIAPAPAPAPAPSPAPSPAPAPSPCPPLPTNYTLVDFEAPHAFVSWSGGTMYDEFTFNPYGAGTYWYGGTYAPPSGWSPFTITVNSPASNKFNRIKFIKAGETMMKIYGNTGTVQTYVLDTVITEVDEFTTLDWIVFNTAACGEYITHITFEMVGTTSFGLFAIDNLEFGTVP